MLIARAGPQTAAPMAKSGLMGQQGFLPAIRRASSRIAAAKVARRVWRARVKAASPMAVGGAGVVVGAVAAAVVRADLAGALLVLRRRSVRKAKREAVVRALQCVLHRTSLAVSSG